MRLVRADGNVRMQNALSHPYVRTVVDILLQHRDTLGFTAEILQTYIYPLSPGFAEALAAIRTSFSQVDDEGKTFVPTHITLLTETLDKVYRQNKEKVDDQRGAIVELFGRRLVCPRYKNDQECSNSRRFEDDHGHRITIQEVDIAALSHERRHIEAYECKMKAVSLASDDCIDLAYLLKAAEEDDYRANAGVVSFDSDKTVRRRLNKLQSVMEHVPTSKDIKAYGLESIELLQRSPFEPF